MKINITVLELKKSCTPYHDRFKCYFGRLEIVNKVIITCTFVSDKKFHFLNTYFSSIHTDVVLKHQLSYL